MNSEPFPSIVTFLPFNKLIPIVILIESVGQKSYLPLGKEIIADSYFTDLFIASFNAGITLLLFPGIYPKSVIDIISCELILDKKRSDKSNKTYFLFMT
ncbi:hypothetical protein SDC9_100353 [bioreactor metagenome]|uniref:Uncharacterized protein n=1 Tax=bioreactor metagenome TaxID=1076179 RepID=A0A645AK48_9ZZZZ